MVRHYVRKRKTSYSQEDLERALEMIRFGRKILTAAKEFKVPRQTLQNYLKRGNNAKKSRGQTIFTDKQEQSLQSRIFYLSERGFPLTTDYLRKIAYEYAKKLSRRKMLENKIPETWVRDNKASYDWYLSFKKRHPNVTVRVPERLSKARAEAFNKTRVDNFFQDARKVYGDLEIQNLPVLVNNCDETGLSSVPSTASKVLTKKGSRNVQMLSVGERGTLTTLMVCSNDAGDIMPPFLIFKGSVVPDAALYPAGASLH